MAGADEWNSSIAQEVCLSSVRLKLRARENGVEEDGCGLLRIRIVVEVKVEVEDKVEQLLSSFWSSCESSRVCSCGKSHNV